MNWIDIWGYQEQDYRSWPSKINNQEQIIRIRSNFNATKLKLKFSNLYGETPLYFKKIVLP